MRATSRNHIPRGCRQQNISGLSELFHKAYKKQYSSNTMDDTIIEAGTRSAERMMEEKKRCDVVITSNELA